MCEAVSGTLSQKAQLGELWVIISMITRTEDGHEESEADVHRNSVNSAASTKNSFP